MSVFGMKSARRSKVSLAQDDGWQMAEANTRNGIVWWVDPGFLIGSRQRSAAQNMIRCLFASHDRRAVEVAVGDAREDG